MNIATARILVCHPATQGVRRTADAESPFAAPAREVPTADASHRVRRRRAMIRRGLRRALGSAGHDAARRQSESVDAAIITTPRLPAATGDHAGGRRCAARR
jgi:hypothetical protein